MQLLQNIGYIPCVVQYILVAYLTPNSLYLPLTHPYIVVPPPLVATSLFSISVSLLLLCYIHYFLDSTYKWYHIVFIFLCLTYFT